MSVIIARHACGNPGLAIVDALRRLLLPATTAD
jgi:hypothetical protein